MLKSTQVGQRNWSGKHCVVAVVRMPYGAGSWPHFPVRWFLSFDLQCEVNCGLATFDQKKDRITFLVFADLFIKT